MNASSAEISLARSLRITLVQELVSQGALSFADGTDLLALPLTPGDETTQFDDSALLKCPVCGQTNLGQTGEYPCSACGLPTVWDTQD